MEQTIAQFQEMNPGLNIETTIIDREAYKTQIRNFLTANAPDVANWYAANRMKPYVEAGLFEDVSDLWMEPEIAENLASTKGELITTHGQMFASTEYFDSYAFHRAYTILPTAKGWTNAKGPWRVRLQVDMMPPFPHRTSKPVPCR